MPHHVVATGARDVPAGPGVDPCRLRMGGGAAAPGNPDAQAGVGPRGLPHRPALSKAVPPAAGRVAVETRGEIPALRRKVAGFCLAGVLMLACSIGAAAQERPAQERPAQDRPAQDRPARPPAVAEPISRDTMLRLLGRDVTNAGGDVVAQVVNLIVDASGTPRAAVLDYGGFLGVGKRRIAVAWSALSFTPGEKPRIVLSLTRDQLANFPEFKADEAPVMAVPPPGSPGAQPARAGSE